MNCYFSKVTRKMNNRPMAWDRSGRQYFVCPPEVRSTLDKDVFFQPRLERDEPIDQQRLINNYKILLEIMVGLLDLQLMIEMWDLDPMFLHYVVFIVKIVVFIHKLEPNSLNFLYDFKSLKSVLDLQS